MNVTVNAISAKVGGAATYLANVLPELKRRIVEDQKGRLVVYRGEGSFPEGIEYRFDAAASEGPAPLDGLAPVLDGAALTRLERLELVTRGPADRGEALTLTPRGRLLGGGVTAELLA